MHVCMGVRAMMHMCVNTQSRACETVAGFCLRMTDHFLFRLLLPRRSWCVWWSGKAISVQDGGDRGLQVQGHGECSRVWQDELVFFFVQNCI